MTSDNGDTPQVDRVVRNFIHDGMEWFAWPSGSSAYGTGTIGPAALEAVHFARSDAPEVPVYEALISARRFFAMFDDELITLLAGARKVVDPSERPLKPATRRGEGLL